MPWKEVNPMDQKQLMLGDYLSGDYSITDLSIIYSLSRKTIYKWINRYHSYPTTWQNDLSRSPRHRPNQTDVRIVDRILGMKHAHLTWGPRTIIYKLLLEEPDTVWPSASTAGEILKRHGLVRKRRKRNRVSPYSQPLEKANESNIVWSIDFKGQFRLTTGKYCYPLTVTDNYSRYLLCCRAFASPNAKESIKALDMVLYEHGCPVFIRSDNGEPFCSVGLTGLTQLSIHLIKLGITLERIDIGKPQQNGRHERMHRTLKMETCKQPKGSFEEQQLAFDQFTEEYNNQRPHQALRGLTPASHYTDSVRAYPVKIKPPVYDEGMLTRIIRNKGDLKFQGLSLYLCEGLSGERVGMRKTDETLWTIYYYHVPIAFFDEKMNILKPLREPKKRIRRKRSMGNGEKS